MAAKLYEDKVAGTIHPNTFFGLDTEKRTGAFVKDRTNGKAAIGN